MKKILIAVTKNRLRQSITKKRSQPTIIPFNDFITGKGRDFNVFLQYTTEVLFHLHILTRNSGSPGVKKILTIEIVFKHFKRPLYLVRGLF